MSTSTSFISRTLLARTTTFARQPLRSKTSNLPSTRFFHSTPAAMVIKAGDSIPSHSLFRKNPSDKVNIADELASGPGLIIGVPAAFSPGCSEKHIPGYLARPDKLEEFNGKIFIVSVNDAFVMNAWAKDLDTEKAGITLLGDADGSFTEALDVAFDATKLLGNKRSKRYAIRTKDGKVEKVAVEPDNTGVTVSSIEEFLA